MNPVRSGPRSLLLAVVATGILAAAGPVCAQLLKHPPLEFLSGSFVNRFSAKRTRLWPKAGLRRPWPMWMSVTIGRCILPIPCVVANTSIIGGWQSYTQKRLPIGCANWKLGVQSSIEQKMAVFCRGTLVVINIRDWRTSVIGPVWK